MDEPHLQRRVLSMEVSSFFLTTGKFCMLIAVQSTQTQHSNTLNYYYYYYYYYYSCTTYFGRSLDRHPVEDLMVVE